MASDLKGVYVAEAGVGFILLWSGLKNVSLKDTITSLLKGQNPAAVPGTPPSIGVDSAGGSGGGSGASGGTPAAPGDVKGNVAAGKLLAAARGWTGGQWNALYDLWQRESSWSNTAANPSGAYGIPQALGHGSGGAPYPDSYKSANPPRFGGSSNATAQINWGLSYIATTYGTPEKAWAHEQSAGWY